MWLSQSQFIIPIEFVLPQLQHNLHKFAFYMSLTIRSIYNDVYGKRKYSTIENVKVKTVQKNCYRQN